jgi:hypothetical protein
LVMVCLFVVCWFFDWFVDFSCLMASTVDPVFDSWPAAQHRQAQCRTGAHVAKHSFIVVHVCVVDLCNMSGVRVLTASLLYIVCSTAQAFCLPSDKRSTQASLRRAGGLKRLRRRRSRAQIHRFTHFQSASMSALRVLPAFLCYMVVAANMFCTGGQRRLRRRRSLEKA